MVVLGSIASQFATGLGTVAAAIAVCGFLAHARPALTGGSEKRIREATVIGGVVGFALAIVVVFLSALVEEVFS
jgi:hypothetical protein